VSAPEAPSYSSNHWLMSDSDRVAVDTSITPVGRNCKQNRLGLEQGPRQESSHWRGDADKMVDGRRAFLNPFLGNIAPVKLPSSGRADEAP
jgi:hypothetical protein